MCPVKNYNFLDYKIFDDKIVVFKARELGFDDPHHDRLTELFVNDITPDHIENPKLFDAIEKFDKGKFKMHAYVCLENKIDSREIKRISYLLSVLPPKHVFLELNICIPNQDSYDDMRCSVNIPDHIEELNIIIDFPEPFVKLKDTAIIDNILRPLFENLPVSLRSLYFTSNKKPFCPELFSLPPCIEVIVFDGSGDLDSRTSFVPSLELIAATAEGLQEPPLTVGFVIWKKS